MILNCFKIFCLKLNSPISGVVKIYSEVNVAHNLKNANLLVEVVYVRVTAQCYFITIWNKFKLLRNTKTRPVED